MADYYTILTKIGKDKIARALASGITINITQVAVDDAIYEPSENQTELQHEVWRGNVNTVYIHPEHGNWVVVEAKIPADVGGFTIHEVGVFDEDNDLIAIEKSPSIEKGTAETGSVTDLYLRIILEVSNTTAFELQIDPSVVMATKQDITDKVTEHNLDEEAHKLSILKAFTFGTWKGDYYAEEVLNPDNTIAFVSIYKDDTKTELYGTVTFTYNANKKPIRIDYRIGENTYRLILTYNTDNYVISEKQEKI